MTQVRPVYTRLLTIVFAIINYAIETRLFLTNSCVTVSKTFLTTIIWRGHRIVNWIFAGVEQFWDAHATSTTINATVQIPTVTTTMLFLWTGPWRLLMDRAHCHAQLHYVSHWGGCPRPLHSEKMLVTMIVLHFSKVPHPKARIFWQFYIFLPLFWSHFHVWLMNDLFSNLMFGTWMGQIDHIS